MLEQFTFDGFVIELHKVFEGLPDTRQYSPNLRYSMKDAALGAFSMFFSQSASFLSFQRSMEQTQSRSNAQSLFGIETIPSDNQIRNLLDPVPPSAWSSLFSYGFEAFAQSGAFCDYRFFEDHLLIPLDGTDYFQSSKIHCQNCNVKNHSNGKVSYSHKVLTPVIAAPHLTSVIALEPEFVSPQDGAIKQDCEIHAAKRWVEKHPSLALQKAIILGDDLFSREPFCLKLQTQGVRFILVCKPDSHKTLYEWIDFLEKGDDLKTCSTKKWNGRFHEIYTYRFSNQVPIKEGDEALKVNWVECTVTHGKTGDILYKNAFITDFQINSSNASQIVVAGRTRWKVENENNNVLKKQGYHLEHNFGHGKQFLASTLLTLNLLAFLAHTCLDSFDQIYQAIRKKLSKRKTFFQDFTTLTKYLFFSSWNKLLEFMYDQLEILPLRPG